MSNQFLDLTGFQTLVDNLPVVKDKQIVDNKLETIGWDSWHEYNDYFGFLADNSTPFNYLMNIKTDSKKNLIIVDQWAEDEFGRIETPAYNIVGGTRNRLGHATTESLVGGGKNRLFRARDALMSGYKNFLYVTENSTISVGYGNLIRHDANSAIFAGKDNIIQGVITEFDSDRDPKFSSQSNGIAGHSIKMYDCTGCFGSGVNHVLNGISYGVVGGLWNELTNDCETAFGKYSKSNAGQLFAIGNGTGSGNRHNAFEVGGGIGSEYLKLGDVELTKTLLAHLVDIDTLLANKQNLITVQSKLASGLVDDSGSNNKFVTSLEKSIWNGKQDAYFAVGDAAYSLVMLNGYTPEYWNQVNANFSVALGVANIILRDPDNPEYGYNPRAAFAAGSGNIIQGLHGFAGNAANLVSGDDAASFGKYNHAGGERSFSQGASTNATGKYSHSEGNKTRARAESTHSEGSYTQAEGHASHTEGYGCIVGPGAEVLIDWPFNPNQNPGYVGHAEGYCTHVLGLIDHSEGFYTIAKALASHSEGGYGIASGDYSHIQGLGTQTTENGIIISTHEASGEASFVGGEHSKATGLAATALGLHLWSKNIGEFATGKWNIDDNNANRLFSIGNGTDEQNRHNAFEVGGAAGQEYLKLGDVQLTKVLLAHLADIDTLLANKQDVISATTTISADFVDDTSANNKFVTTSEKTAWNNKQDALTFDNAPTTNSNNPVKSSGIKTALDTLSNSVYNKNEASALFAAKEDVTRVSLDQTDIVEIDSDAKMLEFADRVNSGTTFEGKIVRLTADVNLNTTIGITSSLPFMGCFDGQGHTVTINQTLSNPDGFGGLFSFVRTPASGSIYIKDVRVTGRIEATNNNSGSGFFGGLISCVDGNTSGTGGTINIINVQNSIYINCGFNNMWTGVGGMIGFTRHASGLKPLIINFESCLWDGVINAGPAAYHFGGYVGYTGNNNVGRTLNINIKNCVASGKIAINQDWDQYAGVLIGYGRGATSADATAKVTININNVISNGYMTFRTGTPGSGSTIGHVGRIDGTTELNVTNLYYKAFSRGAISGGAPVVGGGTATSVTNAVVKTDAEFAALVYDSFPSSASWDADKWALFPNIYYPCPRRIFAQFGPPSSLYYVATT